MAKYKFVGFQEHIEIPEGFEKLEVSSEIVFTISDAYQYLSNPEYLSKWFYPINAIEAKPSGKIEFLDANFQGICVAADLGRDITLVSDLFGEFVASIKGNKLNVKFTLLTNDIDSKKNELQALISNLKKLIS